MTTWDEQQRWRAIAAKVNRLRDESFEHTRKLRLLSEQIQDISGTKAVETRQTAVPPPLPRPHKRETVAAPPKERPSRRPVPGPAARGPWEESAREILQGIWSWICVGEEHRPKGVTTEFAVASTWLLRCGIVAIVACLGYFIKWSADVDLIGPEGRVALGILAGLSMVSWGLGIRSDPYRIFRQGLLGGGLLVLYFSNYAAGPMYGLVPMTAAFGLMVLVTVGAGLLALSTDSLLVAMIGLIGGYVTPILFHGGSSGMVPFYTYLLLLNVGILGTAWRKNWRLLHYLGFVMGYIWFAGSFPDLPRAQVPAALAFLSCIFLVHSAIVYLQNMSRNRRATVLEIGYLALNALSFVGLGFWLIRSTYAETEYTAVLTSALAAFYVIHVLFFMKGHKEDRALLVSLLSLSAGFTAWTLPLLLTGGSLTLAFAVLALALLWIGTRHGSHFLQAVSYGLYAVAAVRLPFLDLLREFSFDLGPTLGGLITPDAATTMKAFSARAFVFGGSIGSILAACSLLSKPRRADEGSPLAGGNDIAPVVSARLVQEAARWIGGSLLFAYVHCEVSSFLAFWPAYRLPGLTVLWCSASLLCLWKQGQEREGLSAGIGLAATIALAATVKLLFADLAAWELTSRLNYGVGMSQEHVLGRLATYGSVMGAMAAIWRFSSKGSNEENLAMVSGYGALSVLFLYGTLEVSNAFYFWKHSFQQGSISVLWALFAIGAVASGVWREVKALRFIGLTLFSVVVVKVFLFDLSNMEMIHRVVAFMFVGIALLLGSFAYAYSRGKFTWDQGKTESPEGRRV